MLTGRIGIPLPRNDGAEASSGHGDLAWLREIPPIS
jgi:hypothetical protein